MEHCEEYHQLRTHTLGLSQVILIQQLVLMLSIPYPQVT